MDKATKVAVEKYPHGTFDGEIGDSLRAACVVGYMQAEKDLALTLEDVSEIRNIFCEMVGYPLMTDEETCKEVLRRFNERKGEA